MYKYFTWIEEGYHKGQELISKDQIRTMLTALPKPLEAYATIQDYDKEGSILGCPMFFDIDSPDLMEAYSDTWNLVQDIESELDVTPMVYFSGSKGFHIVVPLYIRHPRCHEIARMIASEYSQHNFDGAVYRDRSMWRCDGTYNSKGGRYKTLTCDEEFLSPLLDRAKDGVEYCEPINYSSMRDMDVSKYIPLLPDRSKEIEVQMNSGAAMMPCLKKLWNMEAPPSGQAHQLCHMMSRWCFVSGLSRGEALSLFGGHPFWKRVNERDYSKVIDSVFRTGNAFIGCRTGRDAELLTPHCYDICQYNREFRMADVFKKIS